MTEPRLSRRHGLRMGERAQAMVEFAITSLVVFLLLIFIIDGGRILWQYVTVSQAAAAGARYASFHGARSAATGYDSIGPGDDALLKTYVLGKVAGLGSSGLNVHMDYLNNSNAVGSRVTVYVTYTVSSFTRLVWEGQPVHLTDNVTTPILN
jgi:Flp pilus assembly protein TadG